MRPLPEEKRNKAKDFVWSCVALAVVIVAPILPILSIFVVVMAVLEMLECFK